MKTSVVMAVCNGEHYLEEQLESISAQSSVPDKILIRDDASSDDSHQVIQRFQNKHPEIKIVFHQNKENLGYKENFRKLLEETDADWVFLCDQDDRWHPDKAEKMLAAIKANPEIEVLASSFEFMDSSSRQYSVPLKKGWSNQNLIPRPIDKGKLEPVCLDELIFHNFFQGCSMLVSKKTVKEFLTRYTDRIPHDWLISLLAAKNGGLYFLNIPLFDYRIHDRNTTGLPQASRFELLNRLRTVNSEYNRSVVIRDSNRVLITIQEKIPEAWTKERAELLKFTEQNLSAIQNRNAREIWSQRSEQPYRKFKSTAGWIMDLIFCLTHQRKS